MKKIVITQVFNIINLLEKALQVAIDLLGFGQGIFGHEIVKDSILEVTI